MTKVFRSTRIVFALLSIAVLASACGGGGGGGSPPPQPQPGSLQFEASSLAVDENAGTATFKITRTGGSDGAVSVSVASSDGSATSGPDYTSVNTTVSFAAGDATAKSVTVPIVDDSVGELDETLTLRLSAPAGGASVGANASATLTIHDNGDSPAAAVLGVGASIKQLTFSWASVPTATHYRLMQKPDGASEFTQVGPDHAAPANSATLDIAVHRHDWVNARYRLEACNAHGCSSSTELATLNAMLQAIGYFKASNTGANDLFGTIALSADGSTLAVGASGEASRARRVNGDEGDESAPSAGAVYVFARDGAQWVQQAYVKASNTDESDSFGESLALSANGDTLVVGADGERSAATDINQDQFNNNAPNAGAVYVFTRTAGQWSQQAYVKASNTDKGDLFGRSVALSSDGNTLAVGAIGEDSIGISPSDDFAPEAGAVYVFTRTAGGTWSQQAHVKAFTPTQNSEFGFSVALSGDGNTLAVGAIGETSAAKGIDGDQNDKTALGAGAVFVFARAAGQWLAHAYVKASNTDAGDHFGFSVALSSDGNTLAVGATGEASIGSSPDDDFAPGAGAVYVFTRPAGKYSQQAYVKAFTPTQNSEFGLSVALSGDGNTLAVGAPGEASAATGIDGDQTDKSAAAAGAVFVFTRTAGQWLADAYVKASNTDLGDNFGFSIALSSDGNTLAAGAIGEDGGARGVGNQIDNAVGQSGAVYMY